MGMGPAGDGVLHTSGIIAMHLPPEPLCVSAMEFAITFEPMSHPSCETAGTLTSAAVRSPPSELVHTRIRGPRAYPLRPDTTASIKSSGPVAARTSPQQSAGASKSDEFTNRRVTRGVVYPNSWDRYGCPL